MSYRRLMEEAEANWPEDEAYSLFMDLIEGDDPADDDQIARQIAHMHKVFSEHSDAADLIARFDAKLAKLRA